MTLITFASIKGSPGVTTLACLVGATWPTGRRPVIAECDPSGGDLAARFSLSARTGWLSLAASARRDDAMVSVEPHLQQLPGGLEVLVGTQGGEAAGVGVLARLGAEQALLAIGNSEGVDVIVDMGRLQRDSTDTHTWLTHSTVVCVVLRSDAASIVHVQERAKALQDLCGVRLVLVVVGGGPYSAAEIERYTGIPVISEIPDDPAAAAVVTAGRGTERRLARSVLATAARRLGQALAGFELRNLSSEGNSIRERSQRLAGDPATIDDIHLEKSETAAHGWLMLQDQP